MSEADHFSSVLNQFVNRSAYTPGQLAHLTSVPKTTIVNWLIGRVKRPRVWHGIVELAAAMRLTEAEANQLLMAARHPSIEILKTETQTGKPCLALDFWSDENRQQKNPPFQPIALPPYFVGRDAELSAIKEELLKKDQTTIICLVGMAGVGKSTIAAKLAYQCRNHFPDGVLWARLDGSNSMSILATFASSYGQDLSQILDLDGRSKIVRSLLSQKRALIILDNAQSSDQIEPLLPPTGRCAVIVTTRHQNLAILAGTKRFEIRPFVPHSNSSLQLFGKILGEQRVAAEQEALSNIANALGHLPLAITITASRLAYEPGWEIKHFSQRIQHVSQRLQLLKFESQNIQGLFQFSHDLLDQTAKTIFSTIGLFGRQSFSVETISTLAKLDFDTTSDGLRQLHNLSLVTHHKSQRYGVHPLLQDFAQNLYIQAPHTTISELMAYWLAFLDTYEHHFDLLEDELSHIENALKIASKEESTSLLGNLLHKLMPYFFGRGMLTKAEQHLLNAKRLLGNTDHQKDRAIIQLHLGRIKRQIQELDPAEDHFESGYQLAQHLDDHNLIALFLTELGILKNCKSEWKAGKSYLLEALALASDPPLPLLEELAILALVEDDLDNAKRYYQMGFEAATTQRHQTQIVLFLKGLGSVNHLSNRPERAKQLFNRGYLIAQKIGFRKGMMIMSNNLGVVAHYAGSADQAWAYLQTALGEALKLNDRQSQGFIEDNLEQLDKTGAKNLKDAEKKNRLKVFI